MNITPLADRVVIRRIPESETMLNGILIIPDTAKEKPQEGTVVSVGPGRYSPEGRLIPIDVKAGDRILFGKYSGTEIKVNGEELLILREDEILAKET